MNVCMYVCMYITYRISPPFLRRESGARCKELGERQVQTVSFRARRVSPARSGASCSGQKGGGNNTLVCARPPCGKSPMKDKRACNILSCLFQR